MAKKSWAWTTELNPYTQRTLRTLAKRVFFLQRRPSILSPQNQESQRTKVKKKENIRPSKPIIREFIKHRKTYDSRATKSWESTIKLNSYTQSTLILLAKRFFLPRRQIILRPQNQESQRTKVDIRKNQSTFKTYYTGVHQTKKDIWF